MAQLGAENQKSAGTAAELPMNRQLLVEVAESTSWQLRYLVGPDAAPFLQWRSQMTDEEWVDLYASDDETWYRRIERDFGMDTRPKNMPAVLGSS